jgi:hypothetical protein
MYLSEVETHFANESHPKGGVAPTRHALARHAYLERQRGWAKSNSVGSAITFFWPVLSNSLARVILMFTRIGAFLSVGHLMNTNPGAQVADSSKDAVMSAE